LSDLLKRLEKGPSVGARAAVSALLARREAARTVRLAPGERAFPGGPMLLEGKSFPGPWIAPGETRVVVATLRMGFGHYRIAKAAASWLAEEGASAYVHDPLAIPSPGARAIRRLDRVYSAGSRLAAEIGGPVERVWGRLMTNGDASSLAASIHLAKRLAPLMDGIPRDWPVIAAHPFNAHLAVAAGFERVVHLVPDFHPQPFLYAPGALNLVQGSPAREAMLELGVPEREVETAGHWVPREIARSVASDAAARLARLTRRSPVRFLVSIGGAGGQKRFYEEWIATVGRREKARLIVNAGDNAATRDALSKALEGAGPVETIRTWEALEVFIRRHPLEGSGPARPVLVALPNARAAMAATDALTRVADVLVTKPSELAFYPIPKLLVRRVGDHEAKSAVRANDLGEATVEARTPEAAAEFACIMHSHPRLLRLMNERILRNASSGLYEGARVAAARALGRTG
jgi:hypothetical protein